MIEMIDLAWRLYCKKVANGLLLPDNEKMMQLQLALILQSLGPLFERTSGESIKVLLEVPETIRVAEGRIVDIVVEHNIDGTFSRVAIELKCFRLMARNGLRKRGAQNLGMYDYWEDIENIEGYVQLPSYRAGMQFTITDDPYYVEGGHKGAQVAVFSTCKQRNAVAGRLAYAMPNRKGEISLRGTYSMDGWTKEGSFYFISQEVRS